MPVPAGREAIVATAATVFTLVSGALAAHRWGLVGLLLPLGRVLAAILLMRPLLTMVLVIAVVILFEKSTFGLFTFTYSFYGSVAKDITILDTLVGFAVLSVAVDLLRHGRPMQFPGPLRAPLTILALAMVGSVIMSHAAGASLHLALLSEDTLAYLLFLPLAVANLDIDERQLRYLLYGALALATVKAILGLVEVADDHGLTIEGIGNITYYESTPNWIVMMGLFSIIAAIVVRVKPPWWTLLGGALLFASLLLSYRRSFWIAALVGFAFILLLGLAPMGRRLLIPIVLGMIAAIWALSSMSVQSQSPIVKRATSLNPTAVEANVSDRYRIDERVNVWANVRDHPITGLGMTTPWKALIRPLSVETEAGREYVHFATLWYWVKLGILGLLAYLSILAGSAILAWRAWRYCRTPALRVFGLASLCAIAGLVVIETTATFTGADPRFTVIFATQLGLLALAAKMGETANERLEREDEHALAV
jgi:hypothetical protein